MATLQSLIILAALAAPAQNGGAVLLDFSAKWCGPCQQMKPVVNRLKQDGYPVQIVDFDKYRGYASQLGVMRIPTFIMMKNNKVVCRHTGPLSRQGLLQMMATAGVTPPGQAPSQMPGQSPGQAQLAATPPPIHIPDLQQTTPAAQPRRNAAAERQLTPIPTTVNPADSEITLAGRNGPIATTSHHSSGQPGDACDAAQLAGLSAAERRAMFATVRIRVSDATGESVATGTIIDMHGDEALVLTCGHVFRDSKGKGRITVDFCAPGTRAGTPATLITFDASKHDVGLISVRPGVKIQPAPVGGTSFRPQRGVRVFSIGCDRGADASIRRSNINSANRYDGPANIQVAGQPVDGRSGGGLFDTSGQLIGICNAADPTDNEGIYAALPSIHAQLAKIGQQQIYQRRAPSASAQQQQVPIRNVGDRQPAGSNVEVIIIVRPKDNPDAPGEQMMLQNPSPEFLRQLKQEKQRQTAGMHASNNIGPIIRAQSE